MHLHPSDCTYFHRIWQKFNRLNEELMHFTYIVFHFKKDGRNSKTTICFLCINKNYLLNLWCPWHFHFYWHLTVFILFKVLYFVMREILFGYFVLPFENCIDGNRGILPFVFSAANAVCYTQSLDGSHF